MMTTLNVKDRTITSKDIVRRLKERVHQIASRRTLRGDFGNPFERKKYSQKYFPGVVYSFYEESLQEIASKKLEEKGLAKVNQNNPSKVLELLNKGFTPFLVSSELMSSENAKIIWFWKKGG